MKKTLNSLKRLYLAGMISKAAKLEVEKQLLERLKGEESENDAHLSFG